MHEEQFSLEIFADKDYESFVKDFMRLELEPLNQIQIDYLYNLYMDEDDMPLINPAFQKIAMEMDWKPIYFQRHLEHLLNYSLQERDAIVDNLQKYFKTPNTDLSIDNRLSSEVVNIVSPELQFFQLLHPVYQELLSKGELADRPATFADLVDAAIKSELLEDKERFLRSYLNKQELEKQAKGEAERSDLSPGLDF
ncbi:TPA: hypothetical protein U2B60_000006 [Streptococcus suis]|uniref:hypothetical protein n=1 Tax=Streptococcus suis TaxID=1307 RepID=UPI001557E580|nr:hypothetical protein [Streptococcus suis]HEL1757003.1 hypothetical protein [Streptococcus suis]HEM6022159.1 hypothetical protein [Streptococcus suis]HEM6037592.1 hypothetical protein [Streptococcus suis]